MGLISDFLRFLGVVFLGMRDRSHAFGEDLEMAERYARWGSERGDIRDYQAALKHCERCNDEDTPKNDLLLRKYATLFEILLGIIQHTIRLYRERDAQARERIHAMDEEINSARKNLEAARDHIRRLQKDGNMIKAKGEMRHVEELERSVARLEQKRNENSVWQAIQDDYRRTLEEVMRLRTRMELGQATLRGVEDVPSASKDNVISSAQAMLRSLEHDLTTVAPEGAVTPDQLSATMPPPAAPDDAPAGDSGS
ncbi:MAG: hypothetical protein ACOCX4_01085 [Planctomycetota bacterium]